MIRRFRGLGVAMITPFLENNDIDFNALEKLTEDLVSSGTVNFLVPLGTTSEVPTLSPNEQKDILKCIIEVNAGRLPLLVGIGSNSTHGVLDKIDRFGAFPLDGYLVVVPYYNKPTQKGLFLHFSTIAKKTDLPIILYNIPGRTGVNMLVETTVQLDKEHENIVGIKEATGDMGQIKETIEKTSKDFLMLSGDDALVSSVMAAGGDGSISVIGNALPKPFGTIINHLKEGNYDKGATELESLKNCISLLFKDGNPAGIKALMSLQGKIQNVLRLPLTVADPSTLEGLAVELDRL